VGMLSVNVVFGYRQYFGTRALSSEESHNTEHKMQTMQTPNFGSEHRGLGNE
jgi:hypothetical protein